MLARSGNLSETKRRQLFERRILVLHGVLAFIVLIIVGRLIELQVVKGKEYLDQAQKQFGGVVLSANRGEILSRNSKTNETSIFATNTTLDLLYIDPLSLPGSYAEVADALANILVTKEFDAVCRLGSASCPTELTTFYAAAFNPLNKVNVRETFTASGGYTVSLLTGATVSPEQTVPDIAEIKRLFARKIEERIQNKTVTFVPLLYSANKKQMADTQSLNIPGIFVNVEQSLVYANPDQVDQESVSDTARRLSTILENDPVAIRARLLRRPLRYVPIMGKLPPELSKKVRELKEKYAQKVKEQMAALKLTTKGAIAKIEDPYRAIALIPETWRFYPDTRIASHVVGFVNALKEPQYGVERTYDASLRGTEGLIASVKDPFGGQNFLAVYDQKSIEAEDGATIVLTIDRFVQAKVEELLDAMVKKVDAESGQVLVMDPKTGRIVAMANAPLFDNNTYTAVYEKEPVVIDSNREKQIVVEIFNPQDNKRVLKAYLPDLAPENRKNLLKETQEKLMEIEKLYDLKTVTRYYMYLGDNNRREIFPTQKRGVWLKYKNNIGVGSYVNRTIQEVYEPGSVMKPVTMAIAIDQGEVTPLDIYNDTGAIKVDRFIIKNALNKFYGRVTMSDCIDFSINTCMTSVSAKLGRKLFQSGLESFGFGRITGIELDSELPGVLKPWNEWDPALLLTSSFGQGMTVTALQMITAYAPLANGGKLMKPTIVDEIRRSDGTVEKTHPEIVAQVIKPETSEALTAMLTHSAEVGFAKAGAVPGHRVAGKTGTSQIAGPGGKYETGTGSTTATYAGYAPVDDPKFIVLVKLDRPKKDDFGSKSAAPLFKDIATFLFEYYGIPPDEKR